MNHSVRYLARWFTPPMLLRILVGLTVVFAIPTFASTFSLQGRILKPDGTALEASSVEFRVRILAPDSNACTLYEEAVPRNMTGTAGLFSISLNDGTGTRSDGLPHAFEKTFSNQSAFSVPA
ncbi:MAG: hypothetical protein EOP04_20045, partial [Proteobacteria bacterium]